MRNKYLYFFYLTMCLHIVIYFAISCKNHAINKNDCVSFDTLHFYSTISERWPAKKPKDVVEAVKLLESMADKNFNCGIINMDETNLYFNLGLKIRNEWVRHGEKSLKTQLLTKVKIGMDATSGFIIAIYKEALIEKHNFDINKIIDLKKYKDSTGEREAELLKIQDGIIQNQ